MAEQAEDEAGREEDDYGLDPRVVPSVREAIEAGDAGAIDALMEPLHAADIADVLEQIGASDRQALVRLWPQGIDGDVLSELDEAIREDVIEALPHEVLT
ncbi:magnesium transporter MgtE N-terminal domain-containing protein, partial [Albidovulum sp.]|uniref:magnesium transporter MgtE N-terminal domain-containing protein n=1 Tax=Albidovulum sp. TaxID=1872424 RepID=UPI0039B87645